MTPEREVYGHRRRRKEQKHHDPLADRALWREVLEERLIARTVKLWIPGFRPDLVSFRKTPLIFGRHAAQASRMLTPI
jgi:hypothetical protein